MDFNFFNFEFYSPYFFLLFLIFIPLIIRDIRSGPKQGTAVPSTVRMSETGGHKFVFFLLKFFKYLILSAIIIVLDAPRADNAYSLDTSCVLRCH